MSTKEQIHVQEFKDKRDEHRIRAKHINGNIMYSSTQGYQNIKECRHGAVTPSIAIIDKYRETLTEDQVGELYDILKSLDR